jgi:DNA-binding response OmpR family regulator
VKNFGENLFYNTRLKSVFKEDEEIKLTKNEITFLELILSNQKQLICYDIITQELFQSQNSDVNLASIKNMILRMRKKLDTQLVESVSGVGYRVL